MGNRTNKGKFEGDDHKDAEQKEELAQPDDTAAKDDIDISFDKMNAEQQLKRRHQQGYFLSSKFVHHQACQKEQKEELAQSEEKQYVIEAEVVAVVQAEYGPHLECCICTDLLVSSRSLVCCAAVSCHQCLAAWMAQQEREEKTPTCPGCRREIESEPVPCLVVDNLIQETHLKEKSEEDREEYRQRKAQYLVWKKEHEKKEMVQAQSAIGTCPDAATFNNQQDEKDEELYDAGVDEETSMGDTRRSPSEIRDSVYVDHGQTDGVTATADNGDGKHNKPCRNWQKSGSCSRGNSCWFRHGNANQGGGQGGGRGGGGHNNQNRDICWDYNSAEGCSRHKCRWRHDSPQIDQRQIAKQRRNNQKMYGAGGDEETTMGDTPANDNETVDGGAMYRQNSLLSMEEQFTIYGNKILYR